VHEEMSFTISQKIEALKAYKVYKIGK
jgi:hypothetical protein